MKQYLFTSESVTEGHPDKLCDMVADAILDAHLREDANARVACEVTAAAGILTIMGEITSNASVDMVKVARDTIAEIGFTKEGNGFDANTCTVVISVHKQSPDINMGVSSSLEQKEKNTAEQSDEEDCEFLGAGDQGMMFGYACNETDSLMPAPIYYAHKLCKRLTEVRKSNQVDYFGPDGKSMVTFEYQNGMPYRAETIVISIQHLTGTDQEKIRNDVIQQVIKPVIPEPFIDRETKILVNPTGRFVLGGPAADTGLTGRKIIVDTYGGMGRHGGGAFSGKDATKVDRTGAYAARYIAKNIVAARIADRCEVQIAYAIGVANPVSVNVNTFGTSKVSEDKLEKMIRPVFDLRPASLIRQFSMREPIYKQLASYGHLGREDLDVAWEALDKAPSIRRYFQKELGDRS